MIVRPENAEDAAEIRALLAIAFADVPHSNGTEGAIVDAMRMDGSLTVSLVAEKQGEIFGHVAFSAVEIEGQKAAWYGLGPVAVRPDQQRRGIGSRLIEEGLGRARALGAAGWSFSATLTTILASALRPTRRCFFLAFLPNISSD